MSERPSVGIVLVNFNGMKFMPECLESLSKIDYKNSKIFVVDNASSDGSVEWIEKNYPSVQLIKLSKNTGFTGGNNAGIQRLLEEHCDYILMLNNDTVVMPNFLSHLVANADAQTITIPKIYFHDRPKIINNHLGSYSRWRAIHLDWFYGKEDSPESLRLCEVSMANGCALLIPRQVIERIGVLDEQYFLYSEDVDFFLRAVRAGFKIKFIPDAVLYHKESSSSGGTTSPLSIYYTSRNRLFCFWKDTRGRPDLRLLGMLYIGSTRVIRLAQYALKGQFALLRALWMGTWDFLIGRMGFAEASRYRK